MDSSKYDIFRKIKLFVPTTRVAIKILFRGKKFIRREIERTIENSLASREARRIYPLRISPRGTTAIWPRLGIIFFQCPKEIDNPAPSKGKHRRSYKLKQFTVRCIEGFVCPFQFSRTHFWQRHYVKTAWHIEVDSSACEKKKKHYPRWKCISTVETLDEDRRNVNSI